jgi:hypothetical protein
MPSLQEDESEARSNIKPLKLAMTGIPNRELLGGPAVSTAPASTEDSFDLRPLPRRPVHTIAPQRSDESAGSRD